MEAIASKLQKMSPQFVVADLDRSIEFYTTKLGFEVEFRYDDFYAGILRDGFSVHLKTGSVPSDARKKKKLNEDLDIVFGVSGVDRLYEEFSGKNVEIVKPLSDMPYGREFYAVDPDGYILAFLE